MLGVVGDAVDVATKSNERFDTHIVWRNLMPDGLGDTRGTTHAY